LQTSHRWTFGDHAFAFCVPQDRSRWAELDEGTIVLCTSADFEPLCSLPAGDVVPCVCQEGGPRCSPAFCRCDDDGCDADVEWDLIQVQLTVDGDTMTGSWSHRSSPPWTGSLRREAP
jgi:hypothetical protein